MTALERSPKVSVVRRLEVLRSVANGSSLSHLPAIRPPGSAFQNVAARAEARVERQARRIAELTARFEANPSPVVQRMIRQAVQAKARIQVMAARRVAAIQRAFRFMARGRRG